MKEHFSALTHDRYAVGEGPIWDAQTGQLYWVDIIGKTLQAYAPATAQIRVWNCADFPTALAISKSGNKALVALASGTAWLDFEGGSFTSFVNPESLPGNRLNEGKCDPQGRFWTGSMQTNLNPDGTGRDMDCNSGALFRIDPDGAQTVHTNREFGISNTMAWSPDGKTFYFGDSIRNVIFAYDWNGDEGTISNGRVLLEGFERGAPDGSAIDEEGCLWNARFGGACLIRITPAGKVDRVIDVPVTNPTSCTFGGDDRQTLFVTSARFTLDEEQLSANPMEGAVLQAPSPVAGLPDVRFGSG